MKEIAKTMVLWILTIIITAAIAFVAGMYKGVERFQTKWGIQTSDNLNYTINVERSENFVMDEVEKTIETTYIK